MRAAVPQIRSAVARKRGLWDLSAAPNNSAIERCKNVPAPPNCCLPVTVLATRVSVPSCDGVGGSAQPDERIGTERSVHDAGLEASSPMTARVRPSRTRVAGAPLGRRARLLPEPAHKLRFGEPPAPRHRRPRGLESRALGVRVGLPAGTRPEANRRTSRLLAPSTPTRGKMRFLR